MTAPAVPPLISSDGHLEVRPERWSPRMPAKYRDQAPRTIKLPDGGDAILVEGQPPYPAPFLDLRAGRTNETWSPIGVTVDDTAGVGPPEQRLREQDMDLLHAEVLQGDDVAFSSKGHDAPAVYAVLAGTGKIDFERLHALRRLGGLPGHPDIDAVVYLGLGIQSNQAALIPSPKSSTPASAATSRNFPAWFR